GRGLIYDRKGRILADNVPAYRLEVVPDEAGDPKRLIAALSKIVAFSPEDIERFEAERKAGRGFRPVTLKLRLSEAEVARFAVDRWRYPGVELVPYLSRVYPYGELLAHVVGYVGRIDKKDLERLGKSGIGEGTPFTHIGKTGLERYYEEQLRGKPGFQQIETNVDGRPIRSLGTVPAVPGTDLRLSIDVDLQRAMMLSFGDLEGTAVAVDPRTGEILAMVSLPAYDPNLFVNGISHADFKRLNDNPSRPQFNRAVLGGVAPGSTIKPFLGLAGVDSGTRTPEQQTLSTGMFYIGGQRRGYGDSPRGGHGMTDLRKSIYESVNTYYYRLALDMGIDKIDAYLSRYGFGRPTGVDLSGEIAGILPSPEWKAKNAPQQGRWYPGDTAITGIGQGFWKVTPLQLAQATAALANDGWLRRPHLVRDLRTGYAADWTPAPQPEPTRISDHPAHLQAVREGMIATVHGPGTATNIRPGLTYLVAGKTGTAQVVSRRGHAAVHPKSLPMHLRHRALFIAYAPADNPTIAVAVAVEGGGYGASTAAPIARKILDAWVVGKMPETPEDARIQVGVEQGPEVRAEAPGDERQVAQPAGAQTPAKEGRGGDVAAGGRSAKSVTAAGARVSSLTSDAR
ncbi:MAG TPA: penicillin-binding protein 2, partial [Xanthomonadaceae bacterium]|nr:penicillin-binding protein 2 [Xanthomonadaceae bacterium]